MCGLHVYRQLTGERYPQKFQGAEAIRILACALLDVLNEHTAAEGVRGLNWG